MAELNIKIEEFSFEKNGDFMDVTVHGSEGWIELKIETTDSFPIENLEELETIYRTLKANFPKK